MLAVVIYTSSIRDCYPALKAVHEQSQAAGLPDIARSMPANGALPMIASLRNLVLQRDVEGGDDEIPV